MAFVDINLSSLDILNQSYRNPGTMPGSVPVTNYLGTGAPAATDWKYGVADEFIKTLSFSAVDKSYGKQYTLAAFNYGTAPDSTSFLPEPAFSAISAYDGGTMGGSQWSPGLTAPFGQSLTTAAAAVGSTLGGSTSGLLRFKKVSVVVRTDELMVNGQLDQNMLQVQVRLASVAVVRALSCAVFQSLPGTGSDCNDSYAQFTGLPIYMLTYTEQNVTYTESGGPSGMRGGLAAIETLCHPSDGDFGAGPDAFVMSSRARWRLLTELELNGVTPDSRKSSLTGRTQLHYHGVPVLCGRVKEGPNSTDSAPSYTDAWALKLRGPTGVRILHVGGSSKNYGVRVEPRTTVVATNTSSPPEATNASSGIEVFGIYALVVPEPQAVSRLASIPAGDPYSSP